MNNSDLPNYQRGPSRRSFIKKSVVASVAAGNMTMFSGLVNATGSHAYDNCEWRITRAGHTKTFNLEEGGHENLDLQDCQARGCHEDVFCGTYPKNFGTQEEPVYKKDESGELITEPVVLLCGGPSVFGEKKSCLEGSNS